MRLIQQALTFDDVLLVPAHSTVLPREVNLTTQLTKKIKLHILKGERLSIFHQRNIFITVSRDSHASDSRVSGITR